jgi:3-hydroxyisobutyrate dehydrogenase
VTRIAFYGLGTMGMPMARKLVAAGHEIIGHDLDPERAGEFAGEGQAEIAIASLPSAAAVEGVARGLPGTGVGVFVDMSTSPPALARRLAADLGAHGIATLDAPVSGGPRGAEAGTLSIFVGGAAATFERVEPILRALGSVVAHVGPAGAGQVIKLCNNLMAGVNMAAIAEACAVATREGIDPRLFYELVTASTGDSRVLRTRYPLPGADEAHPANHDFEPMFMVDLIVKDLALACELAGENGVDPAVAGAALTEYRKAHQDGHGRLDYSAVYLSISDSPGD